MKTIHDWSIHPAGVRCTKRERLSSSGKLAGGVFVTILGFAACATIDDKKDSPDQARILPSLIPTDRSGLGPLTAELRRKKISLGLNDVKGLQSDRISRALVLLPRDRAKAGIVSFEIEDGPNAGVHQCEVLGRGKTATTKIPGGIRSAIDGKTIYYAPMDVENGSTLPGIYDVRNISPDTYDIEFLNSPADLKGEEDVLTRTQSPDPGSKPYFSGVWRTWYTKANQAVPIDMIWSEEYQPYSQAAKFPVFERLPEPKNDAEKGFRDKQLSKNKNYYRGPYGRSGLATHTDRWDDPARRTDPKYAGRGELTDFRYRDTSGCLKVRADCLELLNEFIAEQARKNRRVQYEVRQSRGLDRIPAVSFP